MLLITQVHIPFKLVHVPHTRLVRGTVGGDNNSADSIRQSARNI